MMPLYIRGPAGRQVAGLGQLDPLPPAIDADNGIVVAADLPWMDPAHVDALIVQAAGLVASHDALMVVLLDPAGVEVPGFRVGRGSHPNPLPRSRWMPIVLAGDDYRPDAHRLEAERFRDRIGDRLLRPEAVAPDKQHLINDDRQRAARVLSLPYRGRVLDVGTSDGTLLLETVRRWDLTGAVGVDVAASAIEEACAALARDPQLAGRVSFQEGFIEELTFGDGSFDTVSACETLEHIGSGQFSRALSNLLRMLRVGGDLFMTVPNRFPDDSYESAGRARWAWPAHHQFFTQSSVRQLLQPHFDELEFMSLYDGEAPGDSIYLICRARGRRP